MQGYEYTENEKALFRSIAEGLDLTYEELESKIIKEYLENLLDRIKYNRGE